MRIQCDIFGREDTGRTECWCHLTTSRASGWGPYVRQLLIPLQIERLHHNQPRPIFHDRRCVGFISLHPVREGTEQHAAGSEMTETTIEQSYLFIHTHIVLVKTASAEKIMSPSSIVPDSYVTLGGVRTSEMCLCRRIMNI